MSSHLDGITAWRYLRMCHSGTKQLFTRLHSTFQHNAIMNNHIGSYVVQYIIKYLVTIVINRRAITVRTLLHVHACISLDMWHTYLYNHILECMHNNCRLTDMDKWCISILSYMCPSMWKMCSKYGFGLVLVCLYNYVTCKCHGQTCCLLCYRVGWCVTSDNPRQEEALWLAQSPGDFRRDRGASWLGGDAAVGQAVRFGIRNEKY